MELTLDEIKATLPADQLAEVERIASAIRADLAHHRPLPATPKPRRRDIGGPFAFDVVH